MKCIRAVNVFNNLIAFDPPLVVTDHDELTTDLVVTDGECVSGRILVNGDPVWQLVIPEIRPPLLTVTDEGGHVLRP